MLRKKIIVFFGCIFILQCLSAAAALSAPDKEVLIAANGGVLEEAPESTFYAFELAVELGATALKVDVRGTKDREIIIMSDETIDRTTNGRGSVGDLLYKEIAVYDAGSWLGKKFEGETVPLLREVLRFAKINDLRVILDVKDQGIEGDVLALVQSLEMMDKVYFWGVLSNLKQAEPSLGGPDLIYLTPEELTPSNIKQAHTQFKDVMTSVLNCDDRDKIRQVIAKGPDIILVDFPGVAADTLNTKDRRRAIRRIQRRSPLVTVPFDGREYKRSTDEEMFADEQRRGIDLLDPVGTLYNLLVGHAYEEQTGGSEKLSPKESLRREVSSLSQELYEPGISEKGFFGRVVGKVMMSDEEADDSRMAALDMTALPPFAVVPRLVGALGSRRAVVRDNAAWALGLIGDYSVMPELYKLLENENEYVEARRDAALSLGRFRQAESAGVLRKRLVKDKMPPVRYDAARSLGVIGDPGAVGDLIRVMEEGVDWRIKGACAGALGKVGDPGAAAKLGKLLTENAGAPYSLWARSQAAWALSSIGDQSLGVLLTALRDDEDLVRRKSTWALIRIGRPAVPALVRALRDNDARVRERAALALGWIGDSNTVPSLVRSIYDENPKVRQTVVWAIGHIGGSSAEKVLTKLVSADVDDRVKEIAGEAIAKKSNR